MITHFNMNTVIDTTWDKEVCVRTSNPANNDEYRTALVISGMTHVVAKTKGTICAVTQHENIVELILNNHVSFKTIENQILEYVKVKLDEEE